jgi:hypothetical protein
VFQQKIQEFQSIIAADLQKQLDVIGTEVDVGKTIVLLEEGKEDSGIESFAGGWLRLGVGARFKISFLAPESGTLTLRLVIPWLWDLQLCATPQLIVAGSPPLRFRVEVESRTIVNVSLLCRSSDPLSFEPGKRNELMLELIDSYLVLEDIQLLKDGIIYDGTREFLPKVRNSIMS